MHDEHSNQNDGLDWEPNNYWTESDWERHLLDNEKLMDRYEAVWNENPYRRWDDPVDLYMKAHHGIDLGESIETTTLDPVEQICLEEKDKDIFSSHDSETDEIFPTSSSSRDVILDELDSITAYHQAFELSSSVLDFFQKYPCQETSQQSLQREFTFHILRIAADIAGGHGLGYDEQGLCGNIVKNRWALGHILEARKMAESFTFESAGASEFNAILSKLFLLEQEIQHRILDLRSKVWW